VLNIAKLVRDQADYYLEAVARSQEEYFTGVGEAAGYWLGRAAGELGLGGRVTEEGLHRILNGAHPLTGGRLGAPPGGVRVAGYDLTFRAPKSVSLLYGLGRPGLRVWCGRRMSRRSLRRWATWSGRRRS
jgi:conjugative relaxase-like TrwC/TraI family protein